MRKVFELGGVVAAAVLIALGIATIVMAFNGHSTVQDSLKQEQITGSPDMTPNAIAPAVKQIKSAQQQIAATESKAGVPQSQQLVFTDVSAPSCTVAGKLVGSGSTARCFAEYMRIHALESTNGLTYSQMGRFKAKPSAPPKQTDFNGGTSNPDYAVGGATSPAPNTARDLWVTETALSTALNASYMADQISLFGLLVGVTLLLTGLGFGILAVGGALRSEDSLLGIFRRPAKPAEKKTPVPTS